MRSGWTKRPAMIRAQNMLNLYEFAGAERWREWGKGLCKRRDKGKQLGKVKSICLTILVCGGDGGDAAKSTDHDDDAGNGDDMSLIHHVRFAFHWRRRRRSEVYFFVFHVIWYLRLNPMDFKIVQCGTATGFRQLLFIFVRIFDSSRWIWQAAMGQTMALNSTSINSVDDHFPLWDRMPWIRIRLVFDECCAHRRCRVWHIAIAIARMTQYT